jgi:hypothetical protein
MGDQRLENADMGKSTRGAATERQANHRPPDTAEANLIATIWGALATSD